MLNIIRPLLSIHYWIDLRPADITPIFFTILGVKLAVFFAAGIVLRVLAGRKRKNPPLFRVLTRIARMLFTISFVGVVFYFFDYEGVYALSARFWWLLIAAGVIVWTVFIILDIVKRYPAEKRVLAERLRREKYLPK